ncbi:hypothetical protein Golax_024429 [Gossypium laxum]|uniref:Uncharacterized protein n=1 Tax=Gossypium laxum TaxID=34288 RepID=A0A7J8ZDH2_9ROSI|nr:hypothetical protein [Gossypium laxum]
MVSIEKSMKPSRSIIADALYTQYTELHMKQIREWNKCQQEKTTTLTSFQRKAMSATQKEIRESSHPKLDWMIHWIDEEEESEGEEGKEEGEEMDFEEEEED